MRKSIYKVLTVLWMVSFLFVPLPGMAQEMSLDLGLDEISEQISKSIPTNRARTIAVMDFNDLQGNVTLLGRFIGEELVTRLVQTNQFKVIERSLLEKALQELKFNSGDLVDPSVAKQLGKVVGADAIVTGTLTELGESIKINARIITVESGEIIGAASALIVKDSTIEGMLKKALTSSKGSGHGTAVESIGRSEVAMEKSSEEVETSKSGEPKPTTYEDDFFRVTVKSFTRASRTATLEVWYENLSDEVIKLRSLNWGSGYEYWGHRGTSLLSENGNHWNYVQDTQVGHRGVDLDLIPNQKLLNKITFTLAEDDESKVFTYTGDYSITSKNRANNRSIKVIIRNVQ